MGFQEIVPLNAANVIADGVGRELSAHTEPWEALLESTLTALTAEMGLPRPAPRRDSESEAPPAAPAPAAEHEGPPYVRVVRPTPARRKGWDLSQGHPSEAPAHAGDRGQEGWGGSGEWEGTTFICPSEVGQGGRLSLPR